jgi:4-hydroxy-tetrahydrodipicolinate synthase
VPNRPLAGIIPAMVTPFRADERIDCSAWQKIIDAQIAAGVDGLFVCGSQGEFFALDMEERAMALRFAAQAAARRVPVLGNVGAVTTRDTIKLAHQAEADGLDYVVIITPYYLRPSPAELTEHYIEVCRAVHLPVLAYNFPLHGGVSLSAATLAEVAARCENLVGVKDSSGKLEQALAYKDCLPGREMAVFVGSDDLLTSAVEAGCAGGVNGTANVAPRLYVELYRAVREGRREEAARLQGLVNELFVIHGLHTFPSTVKEALRMAGLPAGSCRRPVGPVPPEAQEKIAAVLERLRDYLPAANSVTGYTTSK